MFFFRRALSNLIKMRMNCLTDFKTLVTDCKFIIAYTANLIFGVYYFPIFIKVVYFFCCNNFVSAKIGIDFSRFFQRAHTGTGVTKYCCIYTDCTAFQVFVVIFIPAGILFWNIQSYKRFYRRTFQFIVTLTKQIKSYNDRVSFMNKIWQYAAARISYKIVR